MILLLSHDRDEHAAVVVDALERRGADVVLFDTARFPQRIGLTVHCSSCAAWRASALVDERSRDLALTKVVWYRRPLPFELDEQVRSSEDRVFAYGECHAAVTGLWSCLDALWINDPVRDEVASRKMYQLNVASGVGLRIPRTCITNCPQEAAQFVAAEGKNGTIYKSFSATERSWRETRLLRSGEETLLDQVRLAPVIFQEHIPAVADLRVTVVGKKVFPAAIEIRQGDYQYDFRMAMEQAVIRPHDLPREVQERLLNLMSFLGILYGAIDLRLTPDGEYVFLEVNPAGQWLFIEVMTGQPITEALCDLMLQT
ncbi:MAG TPA: hypothetical protein VM328_02730 [Fimbriimonadaceae bacterium]|nr:hypothetical protein [Fimbriimonadaceae bacterium]